MHVILNGQLIPETAATVSIFDRGFLYGDGLFETLRVCRGRLFRWADHLARLQRGAAFLQIRVPFTDPELREQARQLIEHNRLPDSLLRLTLSRGVGVRGYSPKGADKPVLAMTLHPVSPANDQNPPLWRAVTSSFRLPAGEVLAQFKTGNKLPQILARAEAEDRDADEALLCNTDGHLVEASAGNLFCVRDGFILSPPLAAGILAGVTRVVVLEICGQLGIPAREAALTPGELLSADGVFVSLSSWGVVEIVSLDARPLRRSPLVEKIRAAYQELLQGNSG